MPSAAKRWGIRPEYDAAASDRTPRRLRQGHVARSEATNCHLSTLASGNAIGECAERTSPQKDVICMANDSVPPPAQSSSADVSNVPQGAPTTSAPVPVPPSPGIPTVIDTSTRWRDIVESPWKWRKASNQA